MPPQSVSRLEDVLDMKSRIRMRESTNVRERNTNPAAFICHPGRGFDVNSSQRDDSGPRPANRRAVGQSRSKGRRRAALVRAEQKKSDSHRRNGDITRIPRAAHQDEGVFPSRCPRLFFLVVLDLARFFFSVAIGNHPRLVFPGVPVVMWAT